MLSLLVLGLVAGAALLVLVLATAQRAWKRTWRELATELHLEEASSSAHGRRLVGAARGFDIEVRHVVERRSVGRRAHVPHRRRHGRTAQASRQTSYLLVTVSGVDPGFTLERDNVLVRLIKPDVQIGDPAFDDRIRIKGDPARALAVLGAKARRLAKTVIAQAAGSVSQQRIRVRVGRIRDVPSVLGSMLDLAELLRRPDRQEIPALLARRALEDPSAGVCLQAFRQLVESYPRCEELREAATKRLDSRDEVLRLEACKVLLPRPKRQSLPAVRALVEFALDPRLESSLRRTALENLAGARFRDEAVPAMARILDTVGEAAEVRRAALQGLVRSHAVDELLSVLPSGDAAEAEQLARGLGRLGDVAAQGRLLGLLDHPASRVRREAAQALGAVGNLRAVAPLREVAGSGTLFQSGVARAAETAIGEIKERVGGTQAGEISLASVEPLEGAVSPADETDTTRGGEVSKA